MPKPDWSSDHAFDAVDYPARPGLGVIATGFSRNAEGKVSFGRQYGVFASQLGPNGGYLLRSATGDEIAWINGTNQADARQVRHQLEVAGGVSIGPAIAGGVSELAAPLRGRVVPAIRPLAAEPPPATTVKPPSATAAVKPPPESSPPPSARARLQAAREARLQAEHTANVRDAVNRGKLPSADTPDGKRLRRDGAWNSPMTRLRTSSGCVKGMAAEAAENNGTLTSPVRRSTCARQAGNRHGFRRRRRSAVGRWTEGEAVRLVNGSVAARLPRSRLHHRYGMGYAI
jgi:hypothetical protein